MEESDRIDISSADGLEIPTDEKNLIYISARDLFEVCGKKLEGLRLVQTNNIPMARGLGSSSACIVAGLAGANQILGNPLSTDDLVDLAAQIEGHPDNTALTTLKSMKMLPTYLPDSGRKLGKSCRPLIL